MPTTEELSNLAEHINNTNNNYQDMIDDSSDAQITAEVQKFKLLNTSFDTTSTDPVSQLEELMDFQKAYFIQVANGVSGLTSSTPNESLTDTFNKTVSRMEEENEKDLTFGNDWNFA